MNVSGSSSTWVRQQGIKNLTDQEAEAIVAKDRESHQRDLFESIARGDFPRWTMFIQVMTEEQARKMPYNPFDLTKVWYQEGIPADRGGRAGTEPQPGKLFPGCGAGRLQPGAVVPGISFSPDKMLQGRLFSYGDAQRYRLGVNHHQIPVNSPKNAPAHPSHRDGQMRVDGNHGATLGYEPNSFGEWQEQPEFKDPPLDLSGAADSWNFREDDSDYYTQPGKLFRLMNPAQQQVLV